MNELVYLFKKYKISMHEIGSGDTIYIERYGVIIPYSQADLCSKTPKQVVKDIIVKVIQDPEYKAKTLLYVKNLPKRPTIVETKSTTLTIDDKKKLIREKLIKNGVI